MTAFGNATGDLNQSDWSRLKIYRALPVASAVHCFFSYERMVDREWRLKPFEWRNFKIKWDKRIILERICFRLESAGRPSAISSDQLWNILLLFSGVMAWTGFLPQRKQGVPLGAVRQPWNTFALKKIMIGNEGKIAITIDFALPWKKILEQIQWRVAWKRSYAFQWVLGFFSVITLQDLN